MRSFSLYAALAVAALVCLPNSHAGEPRTAKIVIECAPDEVARVKAALIGLPVRIYVAELADADGTPRECAEVAPRGPLRSALEAMTGLYEALSGIPREELGEYFQVRKLEITPRRMSFTVIASSTAALDRVRTLVAAGGFTEAGAKPGHVAAGTVSRCGGHLKALFTVSFAPGEGPDSARRETMEPLSIDRLNAKAVEAGITILMFGAERHSVQRAGVTHVTRDVRFEETELASLLAWVRAIDSAPDISVTELHWELAPAKDQGLPGQRIRRATVKVGYAYDPPPPEGSAPAKDGSDR